MSKPFKRLAHFIQPCFFPMRKLEFKMLYDSNELSLSWGHHLKPLYILLTSFFFWLTTHSLMSSSQPVVDEKQMKNKNTWELAPRRARAWHFLDWLRNSDERQAETCWPLTDKKSSSSAHCSATASDFCLLESISRFSRILERNIHVPCWIKRVANLWKKRNEAHKTHQNFFFSVGIETVQRLFCPFLAILGLYGHFWPVYCHFWRQK